MKNYTVFLTLLSMVFLASCGGNRVDVDLSDVVVNEVNINRLEQDIFTMDTSNVLKATEKLQKKYGKFYSGYIAGVINNGNVTDSSYSYRMKRFVNDRDMPKNISQC
jgi:hypothetical protein